MLNIPTPGFIPRSTWPFAKRGEEEYLWVSPLGQWEEKFLSRTHFRGFRHDCGFNVLDIRSANSRFVIALNPGSIFRCFKLNDEYANAIRIAKTFKNLRSTVADECPVTKSVARALTINKIIVGHQMDERDVDSRYYVQNIGRDRIAMPTRYVTEWLFG